MSEIDFELDSKPHIEYSILFKLYRIIQIQVRNQSLLWNFVSMILTTYMTLRQATHAKSMSWAG